jgi:hypothetical protein
VVTAEKTGTPAEWDALARELDTWSANGRGVTLWWRDDDAARAGPELDRLLAAAAGVPLALAVIPAAAERSLALRLAREDAVSVLQHGWMHRNHAPPGERAAELGPHRAGATVLAELAAGWRALEALLGRWFLPILTPPWNRIAEGLVPALAAAGYRGLSTHGPRARREASPGLVQVNAHVDLVDWRARRFLGAPRALRRLVDHLAARRAGRADAAEPTGILTHHLVMDAESLRFVERLVAATRGHRAVRWIAAAEAFAVS